jgi:hypothetical protein
MRKLAIYLLLVLSVGCVEEFVPPTGNYQNLLVVEAFISDNPSSHFVKLSRSYAINTSQDLPETGATVILRNSTGGQFEFVEEEGGRYEVSDFSPEFDNSYVLSIRTANGEEFESDQVRMKKTPEIESIYVGQKTIPSDLEGGLETGFQVYVNSSEKLDDETYMYYSWEDTWEIRTLFQSFLDYDFDTNQDFERKENLSICWQESESTDIIIGTNEGTNRRNIEKQPIRFVSFHYPFLREKYSILVKQYALDVEGYRFWNDLKESNESAGTLYDTQPFQVIGNMKSVQENGSPVLGYFEMTQEVSKRFYITKNDLPQDLWIPSPYQDCLVGADTVVSYQDAPEFLRDGYLIERELFPPGTGYSVVLERCIDCRLRGSIEKPEFWDE